MIYTNNRYNGRVRDIIIYRTAKFINTNRDYHNSSHDSADK